MVSVLQLQKQIFKVFSLAKNDGLQLKIHYKSIVYILTIERTNETHDYNYNRKRPGTEKKGVQLKTGVCPKCGNMMIGTTCMSKQCTT